MGRIGYLQMTTQPGQFGAGSLLYEGHMVQMHVITDTCDYGDDPIANSGVYLKFNGAMVTKKANKIGLT